MPDAKPTIIADHREREIIPELKSRAIVEEKQLDVGDYVCSGRVGVERKRVEDFLTSITDQRLFRQLEALAETYCSPVLIIEGEPESLFLGGLHENAVRGALSSIAIDYKIPIIWTSNSKETAKQLFWMANREQLIGRREVQVRGKRKQASIKEQQLYLVAGLPGINSKRAEKLLKKFKTPEKVFKATEKRLIKVNGFGEKMTKKMKSVLTKEYEED